jgi:hypothetical protein
MMRFRQGIRTLDKIPNGHSYAIGCFQKITADYIRARNAKEPDAYLKAITDIVTFQPTFLDRDKNEHKAEAWIRSIYEEAKAHIEKAEGPAAENSKAIPPPVPATACIGWDSNPRTVALLVQWLRREEVELF